MTNEERIAAIRSALTEELKPTVLEIVDDSHLHAGHSGHGGAGHFTVRIQAADLPSSPVQAHRKIYGILDHLMGPEIHALSIEIVK